MLKPLARNRKIKETIKMYSQKAKKTRDGVYLCSSKHAGGLAAKQRQGCPPARTVYFAGCVTVAA